jgi:hypothetical protein
VKDGYALGENKSSYISPFPACTGISFGITYMKFLTNLVITAIFITDPVWLKKCGYTYMDFNI